MPRTVYAWFAVLLSYIGITQVAATVLSSSVSDIFKSSQSSQSPVGPKASVEYDPNYHDIFPLSGHNFTDKLLNSKDPWIVVFHDGFMSRNWQAMAESLRGVVWVGMVNRVEEKSLLDDIIQREEWTKL